MPTRSRPVTHPSSAPGLTKAKLSLPAADANAIIRKRHLLIDHYTSHRRDKILSFTGSHGIIAVISLSMQ
jgi:hypothetical protein